MDLLLINPVAGHGYAKRVAEQARKLIDARGVRFQIAYTERPGHASELSKKAADQGAGTIFVVGGDGTVIEAARGVVGSNTALAILPAGTGNDFRKSLGIPEHWREALDFALAHEPRLVDAGTVNDRLFVNECGTGFDVMVLEYTMFSKRFLRGIAAYLYGVLRSIISYRPVALEIVREDGARERRRVTVFAVANGGWIGGGMRVAPTANVRDGLLDVVIIGEKTPAKICACLPKLLSGHVLDIPDTETFRCKEIEILSPSLHLNVDGEVSRELSARFRIQPNALFVRA
ncbi:MAG: diacylglycerol kinase family lipid kinase [Oscillospiraceae bacterium]|jgi:YegS/Rv2252/BmrU family lipid kinase|nr:diacylglycerol kinase family lipid kinase [Oscillospiraceae bacterium]